MKHLIAILCVATVCLIALPASADLLTYNGVALNETVTTHCRGLLADNMTVNAGQEKMQFRGIDYLGYCVDVNQYAGSADMTPVSALDVHNGQALAYLFSTYAPLVTTNAQAAALGVAIWEVVTETGHTFDATSGYFYITGNSSIASAANTLLASIPTGNYGLPYGPTVLQSSTAQDFVIDMGFSAPIPEPATMTLLAIGSAGMLIRRRRHVA